MLLRHQYPAGVPCWVDIASPDPEGTSRFYGDVLGWAFEERSPGLVARVDGCDVAGVRRRNPTPGWCTYVSVGAIDAAARRVVDAGGQVLAESADVGDAARVAICADPAGATFGLWQPIAHPGAQLVNAPGTWNWSNLETPDRQGATAFYDAVFGWQALEMTFGDEQSTMLRMPGYGDFLATLDPELRNRHDDPSVPPGFSDAIGWMLSAAGPARWSVTFAVDDPDAIAARAAGLGGAVDVPPHDVGDVRMAVLRDPDGASFTVSRYQP